MKMLFIRNLVIILIKRTYQQVIVSRAIRDNKKLNIQELTTIAGEDFVKEQKDFEEILVPGDGRTFILFLRSHLLIKRK